MRQILYITYDGLTDPLGQSQILAYLKRLSALGNNIVILSFEKEERYGKIKDEVLAIVTENNLIWIPISYTRTPPVFSTIYDIIKGYRVCKTLHKQYKFDIVHCRGYIPAIFGRKMKKSFGVKFIFDMRGWWPDEKLESGSWDKKIYRPVYNYFKKLERKFFRDCDFAVSLTYKGKEEIKRQKLAGESKIGVIPTCVDFDIFQPWSPDHRDKMRQKLGIQPAEKVFVYAGSIGGNYNIDTLVSVFKGFQKNYRQNFLLILSKDPFSDDVRQKFLTAGITRFAIYNVPFTGVTDFLRAGDVGFIFYRMSFSTIGRSPTKLGEYWASGMPIIAFKEIGDLDYILDKYPRSGILLSSDENNWSNELQHLVFPGQDQLRKYAEDYFHVMKGVKFYQSVYDSLCPFQK